MTKGGVIINPDVMEKQSAGISPGYVVAKGGLQALTPPIGGAAWAIRHSRITVTPGDIDTGITDSWAGDVQPWLDHWPT